jgi:hypothetical protein
MDTQRCKSHNFKLFEGILTFSRVRVEDCLISKSRKDLFNLLKVGTYAGGSVPFLVQYTHVPTFFSLGIDMMESRNFIYKKQK